MQRHIFTALSSAFFLASPPLYSQESNLQKFLKEPHPLPQYVEAGYSPLGRSPAVDALLADPFYVPFFAEAIAEKLEKPIDTLEEIANIAFLASGIPQDPMGSFTESLDPPEQFLSAFGDEEGGFLYNKWKAFISIAKEIQTILSPLTDKEKEWLRENFESFFFGNNHSEIYDFFTTESLMPLNFFALASKVDIAKMADSAKKLASIVDGIYERKEKIASLRLKQDFVWIEEEKKFWISGKERAVFKEDADFFLHLKGNCKFENNAGGTKGVKAAALHISLEGNNLFLGDKFVQGAGILGVGILANFKGGNTYKAKMCSQAASFLGIGLLMDRGGKSDFQLGYFGQSAALFGASILWNLKGKSHYFTRDGMAQGAASTLGSAFLVDTAGKSNFILGSAYAGEHRSMGIGQGGSIGVRFDPWRGNPSFYGGLSFLFAGKGKNHFKGGWYSQGAAYFLGAGILVDRGKGSTFSAEIDSQGQGLHLSCGCLLASDAKRFDSGFGSQGIGGDRSAGFFINLGSHAYYIGGEQTIGSARKPQGLGVFLNFKGNNSYLFEDLSCGNLQYPRSPLEWPRALFFSQGNGNQFSKNVDRYARCKGCEWGIPTHSLGCDADPETFSYSAFIDLAPRSPRAFVFDPFLGWTENTAYRSLKLLETEEELEAEVKKIVSSTYDERRSLYESLDLYRYLHRETRIDLSPLLEDPAHAPVDQFNYAALSALNDRDRKAAAIAAKALREEDFSSPYAEKMAIRLVGELGNQKEIAVLERAAGSYWTEENRALGFYYLAKAGNPSFLPFLLHFRSTGKEKMRFAIAMGLKGSSFEPALDILVPMLHDPSFYVKRRAALSLISLGYKPAISALLETLEYPSLDTTENYGDNLYTELASYVGVDFGNDPILWEKWWEASKETFEFPPQIKEKKSSFSK